MKPFLRWAGGKNWLVKKLNNLGPAQFNNYHEPFLGGGSFYFNLDTNNKECFLSDINESLINTYLQIRDNVEAVIELLATYENTEEFYYRIRSQLISEPIERAAQFIYLNQTSFNGIYRVNLKGIYNVPYGRRNKDFIQADTLRTASIKLEGVSLNTGEFDHGMRLVRTGDLVFLDPPYTITHNNNGFIRYNENLFSKADQHRLANFIEEIINIGAFYILTNAAHKIIGEIFHFNQPMVLSRASLIGGKFAARGNYEEYLFTNLPHDIFEAN
ncbi:MAG: DNA adenine methylase [Candidatus Cyclobacteriaceae bacterium M2_1C_046]